jgi:hypothetical protein
VVRERRAAERVEARADDGPDRRRVEPERVDGLHGAVEQLALDALGATLQVQREEVVVELQRAAFDAGALEDALCELVVIEP